MHKRKLAGFVATLTFLLSSCIFGNAQKPQILPPPAPEKTAPAPTQSPKANPQLTKEDLEAFLDGFIPIRAAAR